jgi:hypothetical protein
MSKQLSPKFVATILGSIFVGISLAFCSMDGPASRSSTETAGPSRQVTRQRTRPRKPSTCWRTIMAATARSAPP